MQGSRVPPAATVGLALLLTSLGVFAGALWARRDPGVSGASGVLVQAGPSVVLAIQEVARLESTVFHVEKVVEASDTQSKLWGLLKPKDALLLVAVGDVTAGVDLAKVRPEDVHVDAKTRVVRLRLPAPEIVAVALDEQATHVYVRTTDALASRNEGLEGQARRIAEDQMRDAAIAEGIMSRARGGTERTLRALLRSLGYAEIEFEWPEKS